MSTSMITKAAFFGLVSSAADKFLEMTRGKKDVSTMFCDPHLLSAAKIYDLDASGTPSKCPVSQAIVSAAFYRDNPMRVVADVEVAWAWELRRRGIENSKAA